MGVKTRHLASGQVEDNEFNISLLGFKMAVNEGLTVFNLVDGIVEDLITEFSMIKELEIISRQSCFDFRDKKKMFEKNVIDMSKFTYHVCGIGEKEGTAFTTSNKVGRIKDNGNIAVPIATIDSFNFENVTFIKYDIEGYELKALRGSEQTIKKYSPVVVIEQNRGNSFPQELLESWGYECKGVDKVFNQDYTNFYL